jgi:GNAT superfamily N-acetyltransferase
LSGPEKLARHHEFEAFSCGVESLDSRLKRFAYTNQQSDLTTTYVVHRTNEVAGYYSLTAGSVNREDAPLRVAKGSPNHPIGIVLLARLAVHEPEKGAGLGRALLKDALVQSASAADIIAVKAVLVHALNEEARRLYVRFDFESSPAHPLHLINAVDEGHTGVWLAPVKKASWALTSNGGNDGAVEAIFTVRKRL